MSNTQKCPSVEQLKQLAVGLLPDPPAASLEEHLLECDACALQTSQKLSEKSSSRPLLGH